MARTAPITRDSARLIRDQLYVEQLADVAEAGRDRKGGTYPAFLENLAAPCDRERPQIALGQGFRICRIIIGRGVKMPDHPRVAMAGGRTFDRADQEVAHVV